MVSTAVRYAGGSLEHPTYKEVCSGTTGHAEVVRVIFDPSKTTYKAMLDVFWANHDPTQLNRQGGDKGTQYRGAIFFYSDAQQKLALATRDAFQKRLSEKGFGKIVTQIAPVPPFYFAEGELAIVRSSLLRCCLTPSRRCV